MAPEPSKPGFQRIAKMREVVLILKHEVSTTLRRRSFWLTTFLLPAFIVMLSLGSQALARSSMASDGSSPLLGSIFAGNKPIGYVDQAQVIQALPTPTPEDQSVKAVELRPYAGIAAAQAALEAGEINRYFVVPGDFIADGKFTVVDRNFSVFNSLENNDYFEYVLRYNLAGDATLALLFADPTDKVTAQSLAPQSKPETGSFAEYGVPLAVLLIFYMVITMTSGFMLQSVSKEKENRTIEVLLMSVRPRDLMLGKVLGLGVVALLQVAVWGGASWLFGGISLPGGQLDLPDGFVVWALLYFILGYLLYSSLLGAVGALAPSAREGSKFTFLVMIPLFVPMIMNAVLIDSPNGALSVVLSLFPLTSPIAMLTRLAAVPVPIEQLLLGLLLLAVTSYATVVLASRFFRADTLLAFNSMNWRAMLRLIRR
jgi:ABC-2 type transport system permease protein